MSILKTLYHGSLDWLKQVTGERGVAVINETEHRIHVLDGVTKGGHPLALLSEVPTDAIRASSQSLSEQEKRTARINIGAVGLDEVQDLTELYNKTKLS